MPGAYALLLAHFPPISLWLASLQTRTMSMVTVPRM